MMKKMKWAHIPPTVSLFYDLLSILFQGWQQVTSNLVIPNWEKPLWFLFVLLYRAEVSISIRPWRFWAETYQYSESRCWVRMFKNDLSCTFVMDTDTIRVLAFPDSGLPRLQQNWKEYSGKKYSNFLPKKIVPTIFLPRTLAPELKNLWSPRIWITMTQFYPDPKHWLEWYCKHCYFFWDGGFPWNLPLF